MVGVVVQMQITTVTPTCKNGATCRNNAFGATGNFFECTCATGWIGYTCEEEDPDVGHVPSSIDCRTLNNGKRIGDPICNNGPGVYGVCGWTFGKTTGETGRSTWNDAKALCEKYGARLCKKEEIIRGKELEPEVALTPNILGQ